jgi:hypothetical protein
LQLTFGGFYDEPGRNGLVLSERVPGMTLFTSQIAALHRPAPDYLDALAVQPKAVYSLKKLVSTATKSIRVRRSSDNAEQDIGFTRNELDVSALLAFAGSSSCYVTTFYDQTSGAKHAAQATAANQPRIVNAGVYDRRLIFDGANDSLKITSLANGTPQLGIYTKIKQASSSTNKIIIEASTNFNTAAQAFLMFTGFDSTTGFYIWSLNSSNAAGSSRGNQSNLYSLDRPALLTGLWNRATTGVGEITLYAEGRKMPVDHATPSPVEQTGNFGTFDIYIGARAGTSLFADMEMETLVFYAADTASIRASVEGVVGYGDFFWTARMNTPTTFTKIGSTYFCVDCWHARVLYSDNVNKPITQWSLMDNTLRGPHSIAYDGYMYVIEDTENGGIRTFKSDGAGGFTAITTLSSIGTRTHRVQYDSATSSFYVIGGTSQTMARLTRSGDTLTLQSKITLAFLSGQYSRGFRIYDGKMYIVCEPGKVFEVSFDGASTYTLLNTYNTPTGFSSPNDIFRDSTGKWYLTGTNQAMCRFDRLADMHAGLVEDVYDLFRLGGTPYYLGEFDGYLWIPEIIERSGLTRILNDVPVLVHNFGAENASDLGRHTAAVG